MGRERLPTKCDWCKKKMDQKERCTHAEAATLAVHAQHSRDDKHEGTVCTHASHETYGNLPLLFVLPCHFQHAPPNTNLETS